MGKAIVIALVIAATIETTNGIGNKQMTSNVTQTLDFLLASNRYDKRLRPGFGGSPITVSVNFFIKSMGPVSDNDQSYGLDCYFRQHWYDFRLRYQKLPGLEEFSMSWLFLDRVWKPDTYFINGKRSYLHRITVPNKFLRLRHDGFITYSMRLTISASCPMYLKRFPLDAQRCPLVLGSYGYTNKDLVYKWTDESPIGLQQGVEIAQFDLKNITTENEKIMVKGGLTFSTVQANFWLKRHTGYFMLQVYVPCTLIVVCSWISFWIDPDAVYVPCGLIVLSSWVSFWIDPDDVAARVALGVTTVLSLTTMGFGGRAQLPKVSYWTALDWFVIICFTSVFSVMIEYAVVNFIDKFKKDFKKIIQKKRDDEEILKRRSKFETKAQKREPKPKARSVSFSFSKSSKVETIVEIEPRLPLRKMFPETGARSKSYPNIFLESKQTKERRPRIVVTMFDDDLVDLGPEAESPETESGVREVEVEDAESRRPALKIFFEKLKQPKELFSNIKIPDQKDLINMVEDHDSPTKFSKIDVQSRRNFPIAFFLSLVVYLYAFSYYLTDDIPVIDSRLQKL